MHGPLNVKSLSLVPYICHIYIYSVHNLACYLKFALMSYSSLRPGLLYGSIIPSCLPSKILYVFHISPRFDHPKNIQPKKKKYEAPYYAILSTHLLPPPSNTRTFSTTFPSSTRPMYVTFEVITAATIQTTVSSNSEMCHPRCVYK